MESDALSTKKFPRQRPLLELFAGVWRRQAWQLHQAHRVVQRSSLPARPQASAARRLLPLRVAAGPSLSARGRMRLESTRREVKEAGGQALVVPADVADPEAIARAAERTFDE